MLLADGGGRDHTGGTERFFGHTAHVRRGQAQSRARAARVPQQLWQSDAEIVAADRATIREFRPPFELGAAALHLLADPCALLAMSVRPCATLPSYSWPLLRQLASLAIHFLPSLAALRCYAANASRPTRTTARLSLPSSQRPQRVSIVRPVRTGTAHALGVGPNRPGLCWRARGSGC